MDFPHSTQRRRWLFTPDQLREARQLTRDTSLAAIRTALGEACAALEPITLAEEEALLKFYEGKVQAVCRELRLPRKVLGTAVTYIKRFYTTCSALDYDPHPVVLTCLYLACKAEECYLSAAELGRLSGMPADALLRHELPVLQGLKLDLLVHTPHRAVDGCFAEAAAICTEANGQQAGSQTDGLASLSEEQVQQAKAAAYAAADALLLTDAPLLYTPGQLGLAATRSGFNKIGTKLRVGFIRRAAQKASPVGTDSNAIEEAERRLLIALADIDALGAAGSTAVRQEDVAAIDRKLKACRSPLLDASSGAAQEAAAAKAKAKADKAARKAAKLTEAQAGKEAECLGVVGRELQGVKQQRKRPRGSG